jgi:Cof subfamily protein (haloacid dehalogenase superfamily)
MTNQLPNWEILTPDKARPFGVVKLIAADLDGTLVRSGSSTVYGVIGSLRRSLAHPRYGVALTIATGRTLAGVSSLLKNIDLASEIPLVLYNGSLVVRNTTGKVLLQATMQTETVRKVLSVLQSLPVTVLSYQFIDANVGLFAVPGTPENVFGWSKSYRNEYEFNGLPINWQTDWLTIPQHDALAILILADDNSILAKAHEKICRFSEFSVTFSGGKHIELRPSGSDKACGLAVAAKALGVLREEVLAIGDNDNDSDMLRWAGIGVSVGHASPVAIASSDYQCRYDVEKGVVEVLHLVRQARRYFHVPRLHNRGNSP